MIRRFSLAFMAVVALMSAAFAGEETYTRTKEAAAAPQPFCDWYANREWNATLWGTYAFTGNEWRDDRYLRVDHAWGGGADFKFFFARYFGIGAEGFLLDGRETVGTAMGTFTLRYPLACTRFAPYIFAGGGAIFGDSDFTSPGLFNDDGDDGKALGQFGGGLEFRVTPHIGIMQDFSWSVIDGGDNNFGMVRAGLNFAF
jgi:hypothetical protein